MTTDGNPVYEITFQKWSEIAGLAGGPGTLGYVFRGQGDCVWGLETRLARIGATYGLEGAVLSVCERDMLDTFKRQGHHYFNNPPDTGDDLEWLALMQHHGSPTRLLDFTRSLYVACFFASEQARSDGVVWAIDTVAIREHLEEKERRAGRQLSCTAENVRAVAERSILADEKSNMLLEVGPYRLSERMVAQQATFVMPATLSATFDDCLSGTLGKFVTTRQPGTLTRGDVDWQDKGRTPGVMKMIIPQALRSEVMRQLRAMNITSATLFPGVDGFARSLFYGVGLVQALHSIEVP
jgi:hypothetical protein